MTTTSTSDKFEHQSLQDPKSIGRYLEALAQGFRDGKLSLVSGNKELVLEPRGMLQLSLSTKTSADRVRLNINVQWNPRERAPVEPAPLSIYSPNGQHQ